MPVNEMGDGRFIFIRMTIYETNGMKKSRLFDITVTLDWLIDSTVNNLDLQQENVNNKTHVCVSQTVTIASLTFNNDTIVGLHTRVPCSNR